MIIVSNLPMLITRKLDFILDWAIQAPNFKPRRQIIKDFTRKGSNTSRLDNKMMSSTQHRKNFPFESKYT